jgi:hypothetical protein
MCNIHGGLLAAELQATYLLGSSSGQVLGALNDGAHDQGDLGAQVGRGMT